MILNERWEISQEARVSLGEKQYKTCQNQHREEKIEKENEQGFRTHKLRKREKSKTVLRLEVLLGPLPRIRTVTKESVCRVRDN